MLAVLAFTACESNNDNAVADGGSYLQHVTLQASMGGADTRALSEGEGNVITATFAAGDQVVMVDDDGKTEVGTLTAATAGANTTLSGELNTSKLTNGETVTLHYRSATASYDDQVGTLDGIATGQDYATGTLTVSSLDPLTFESNSVTLVAKQSITKFSFTDGNGGPVVNVKTFGIAATGLVQSIATNGTETVGAVTGTLTTASSDVYVALRNKSGAKQTYSFTIKDDGGNWYTGTKRANLVNGKNYTATVTLTKLDGLTASSAVGTVGVVGGLPAIVVESGKAVALMNAGALCPEDFGGYYTFAALSELGLPDGWYVPTETELNNLVNISSAWTTQNGVNGCLWTIGSNGLFLPAAGFVDKEFTKDADTGLEEVSAYGHYWSSTQNDDTFSFRLNFGYVSDLFYAPTVLTDYKVNELNVRPFHALN